MKHLSHAAALLSAVVLGAGCGDRRTSPTASLVPSFSNGRSGSKHGFGFNGTVSGFPTGVVFLTGGGSYDASTASNTIPSETFVHSGGGFRCTARSEEHTSELQSPCNLVCRLLLEKKKKIICTVLFYLITTQTI